MFDFVFGFGNLRKFTILRLGLYDVLFFFLIELENIVEASAEISIELTEPECPLRTLTHSPVSVCKIMIVLLLESENIVEVSAEIEIDQTKAE